MYLISNHIHQAIKQNTKIYINKVNIDIFKKNRIPAEDFFDLPKTNENLKRLTGGKDLILFEKPLKDFVIPRLCIYPVSSVEILSCLEFQQRFTSIKIPKGYYGLHFRMELDSIIHYLFNENCYNNFMDHCNNGTLSSSFTKNFMECPNVINYINYLLSQYFEYILHFGFNETWYISTLIGKKEIHSCLIPVLKRITDFIIHHGGKVLTMCSQFEERELNALVDLLILRDSSKLIVFEGSSFSEGYCCKVNSINKEVKEYCTVNGIVPKLTDELYESFTDDSSIC